jgi:hypothetical protein
MITWESRPEAVRNLFNPAFCGALLARTVRGYNDSGMDVALAYLALPLVLHAATRTSLPGTVATTIAAWRERQPEHVADFPQHAKTMCEFVDGAIIFAVSAKLVAYDSASGKLRALGSDAVETLIRDDRFAEVSKCLERARFVGRWFAKAGSTIMIFSLLGVRP